MTKNLASRLLPLWLAAIAIGGSRAWTITTRQPVRTRVERDVRLGPSSPRGRRPFPFPCNAAAADGDDDDVVEGDLLRSTATSISQSDEAARLRERARAAREEAVEMERGYAAERIAALEARLADAAGSSSLSEDERRSLAEKLDRLKVFLDPPKKDVEGELAGSSGGDSDGTGTMEGEEGVETTPEGEGEEEKEFVGELSAEELQALEEFESFFGKMDEVMTAMNLDDDDDDVSLNFNASRAGNITREELDDIKDIVNFGNSMSEIFPGLSKIGGDLAEFLNSTSNADGFATLGNLFPSSMMTMDALRAAGGILEDEEVQAFADALVTRGRDAPFAPTAKPRNAVFGHVLEGKPRTDAVDGDALVDALDEIVAGNDALRDRALCYYVRDAGAFDEMGEVAAADAITEKMSEEETDLASILRNVEGVLPPRVLVMPKGLVPLAPSNGGPRLLASVLALYLVLSFVGSCYGGDAFLGGIAADPTMIVGLLGLTLTHQLGHFLAATLNGVKLTMPTLVPSADGLIITNGPEFLGPPKNNKVLFDVAFSGPALGFVASWSTLLLGVKETSSAVSNAQIAALSHVSLDFLRLSSLTSATIETFLGTDTLLSIDPLLDPGVVAVHPLVVAGHLGILANALALLPRGQGTSDGDRMLRGAFSRTSFVNALGGLTSLFVLVQTFREWGVSSLLAVYLFTSGVFEDTSDIPCRNDVDAAGGIRAVACLGSILVAVIAVSPAL